MTGPNNAAAAARATLDDEMQRLSLALHDARLRAHGLAAALEASWKAHLAARQQAERAGLLSPLTE